MKTILLDCAQMTGREEAHDYLARALSFPEWYGRNLDALWDCLTECPETVVVFRHPGAMLSALREYGCRLLQTFFEAERENPALHVVIGNHSAIETEGHR